MQSRVVGALMSGALLAGMAVGPAAAVNNAQLVSSTIPASMSPGYTYDVAVTMRNSGTTTWLDQDGYSLGDQGSTGLVVPGRISAPGGGGVPPGASHTFTFSIRAPVTAGTYTTRWRMVQEHVEWFGETLSRDVVISYGSSVPSTPSITWPPNNTTAGSNRPDITWLATPHDAYEVHVCPQNDPDATVGGWDSGAVGVTEVTTAVMSGVLTPQQWSYAFVRLHNPNGWSAWSTGAMFYVAGQLPDEPYRVGDDVGGQWPHTICYNPDRNEYLLAFNDARPGLRWRISYYILDGEGKRQPSKPEISILDDPELLGTHYASVTYDSRRQEYLIAYGGWLGTPRVDEHDQLRSHRVSADGALIGYNNLIWDGQGGIGDPMRGLSMAYSPTSDVHLLAWKDDKATGSDVYATLLGGAGGQRIGPIIDLSDNDDRYSARPVVAWNSARNEFLVVYQVSCVEAGIPVWHYFGRRIGADNQYISGRFQITSGSGSESGGDLVYDPDLDRYLLAYEYTGAGPWVWGQFLTSEGALSGARFGLLNPPYLGRGAWLTRQPATREFLVGWMDQNSGGNYGRRISQVGVPLGEHFKISGSIAQVGIGNWDPIPKANTVTNEYLYAWTNSYNDVYTRRYKTFPVPDTIPPAPVTQFTATPGHGQNILSWINPTTSDCLGAIIRYKTTGYPAGAHDGLPLAVRPGSPGSSDTFVHAGLNRATTYYYAAFAYDAIPNHAVAALVSARPLAPADFDGDDDVDQEDFGHLQACFCGSGQPIGPQCPDADLDVDGDVDQSDFDVFADCMGGADSPPGC